MEVGHGLLTPVQRLQVQQRLPQPSPQEAPAHGGPGEVQGGVKGRAGAIPSSALEQLQVVAGLPVQGHEGAGGVGGQGVQLAQRGPLSLPQVFDDGAGGAQGQGQAVAAVGLQGGNAEVVQEGQAGVPGVEGR